MRIVVGFLCCWVLTFAQAQVPTVSSGKIIRHAAFPSKFVAERNIDVWLPDGYNPKLKYPVLYMHDGQMLFDTAINWNKQEWRVDETVSQLIADKKIPPIIVVGIWNVSNDRARDYLPQKPILQLGDSVINGLMKEPMIKQMVGKGLQADNYLQFIVKELKPFIDEHYASSAKRRDTYIGGSSMGGLISWYAICEYPEVFGAAMCMSTHWPGLFRANDNPLPGAFFSYLSENLPNPKKHKIYFDCGDKTLDAMYPPLQKKVDIIMQEKGFGAANWKTQYFPGTDHTENAWANRLAIPLVFLLAGK